MSSKPATPLEQRRGYPGENESTRIPVLSPTPFRRSYSLRMRTSRSFHDYQHYRDVDVGCCVCDYGGVGGPAMHHPATNLSSPSTSGGVKVKNSLANGAKPASHHHHHARDTSAPGQSPQDTTAGGKDTLLPNGIVGHGHHGHHHHGSNNNNNGSCGQKSLCSSSQSTRKNSLQKNDRGMVSVECPFFVRGKILLLWRKLHHIDW